MKAQCTVIVPPTVQVMMSGVMLARVYPSGNVQLQYTDGNTESALLTAQQLAEGRDNFFSLVSAVQSMRGPSTRA